METHSSPIFFDQMTLVEWWNQFSGGWAENQASLALDGVKEPCLVCHTDLQLGFTQ